ncbi:heat-inducible transcriptional repressor HrcA [Pseudofulvimonas gallinarii]|jgi:heat-inducible transcriptional repressor|uniref:Heat-inducible transcription repressor HrcA n=1 Tax=Pseudofulvimonas gallinarii TaxID=634155 RepID=A0A4V3UUJ5_9GAMM|nr:heat-inducible transcriptional repressor HrcA [Pseudofulvimonas gallinarii]TCS96323.1 heat-inducible transcription repressor HrcA [Pseudofulvimonas gallinarii]THD14761.1 heat-inducible transcriptional repressor HrcA [Pseudofulvimonas gallinarii]
MTRPAQSDLLDSRSRRLLRALIAQYIRDGQPVGSRTLAKQSGLDVSPATIRNVLADLEEIGLVAAPHTSAGRIPTTQGYRVFVDSLLEVQPLAEREIERLRSELGSPAGTQDLLNSVSGLLSAATHFVGLVTVPRREAFAFRHIDFVPLDGQRVLVILVFTDNEVQNRVIETARPYSRSELEQVANYLNAHYAGLSLTQIRQRLLSELDEARVAMNATMKTTVEIAGAALDVATGEDVVLSGQTNLMGVQELANVERLRNLFDTFNRKQELLQLMDRCIHARGVRLFIGEESGVGPLDQCSLIAAPYGSEGRILGVLGVIGPTRMAYERVIPMVQAASQVLSSVLNGGRPAQ